MPGQCEALSVEGGLGLQVPGVVDGDSAPVAGRVPQSLMRHFYPVAWANLVVVSLSGLLLLTAYPAKALTNPVFYVKLTGVLAALLITRSNRTDGGTAALGSKYLGRRRRFNVWVMQGLRLEFSILCKDGYG